MSRLSLPPARWNHGRTGPLATGDAIPVVPTGDRLHPARRGVRPDRERPMMARFPVQGGTGNGADLTPMRESIESAIV